MLINNQSRNKLYIIGCPRSMTSFVYRLIVSSMGGDLDSASDGEILNQADRIYRPFCQAQRDLLKNNDPLWMPGNKTRRAILRAFENLNGFYVMKDVIDPYNMYHWIAENKFHAIIITKEIPLIAYSCIKNKWYYICDYFSLEYTDRNLVRTLTYIYDNHYKELMQLDKVTSVDNIELIRDAGIIWTRLESIGFSPFRIDYINNEFRAKQQEIEEYRQTDLYKKLLEVYQSIRQK